MNSGCKIISVADDSSPIEEHIARFKPIIEEARSVLGLEIDITNEDLKVYNDFGGGGYGFISKEKIDAVKNFAETEGIFIDPVYTTPAAAAMIDMAKRKKFKKSENILFLHTGGSVALFAYKTPIKAHLQGKKLPWTIPDWSSQST